MVTHTGVVAEPASRGGVALVVAPGATTQRALHAVGLDPRAGVRARFTAEPGVTFGDTQIAYAKLTGEASVYVDLGSDKWPGALRGNQIE